MNTSQQTTSAPREQRPASKSFDDRSTLELRRWLEEIERARTPAAPDPAPDDVP
jgi:hypothetical protein